MLEDVDFALDDQTCNPIHLNYPKELLATVPELPVRSDSVVIEVLEDVRAEPEVLEGLRPELRTASWEKLRDLAYEDHGA